MSDLVKLRLRRALDEVHKALNRSGWSTDGLKIIQVGSAYISDETKTDVDILVLAPEITGNYTSNGWDNGGSEPPGEPNQWTSYKQTFDGVEVNMIITNSLTYFRDWQLSAEVCRFLHLMGADCFYKKGMVHGVHQIIMDRSTAEVELANRKY